MYLFGLQSTMRESNMWYENAEFQNGGIFHIPGSTQIHSDFKAEFKILAVGWLNIPDILKHLEWNTWIYVFFQNFGYLYNWDAHLLS